MKKIIGLAIVAIIVGACSDRASGEREHQMQENTTEAPTTSTQGTTAPYDTSTSGVQDSSTVIGYDTGAVRNN
jgi:hypothetical protein